MTPSLQEPLPPMRLGPAARAGLHALRVLLLALTGMALFAVVRGGA